MVYVCYIYINLALFGMSFWKVTWPFVQNEKWTNPAINENLDKMRDAIIWKKICGDWQSTWAIEVEGNSETVFGSGPLTVVSNTKIKLRDNGSGDYTLTYESPTYKGIPCTLANVDSKNKIIKPDITPYILHKIVLPATGLFATLAGLGYISAQSYKKRKPFIFL